MSKKHFIALADCLREYQETTKTVEPYLLDVLAGFCEAQNPRFNRELWIAYIRGECGPSGGKLKTK